MGYDALEDREILDLAQAVYRTVQSSTTSMQEMGAVLQIMSVLLQLDAAKAQSSNG